MNYRTLRQAIMQKPNGSFTSLLWERPCKVLAKVAKEHPELVVTKRVRATVRLGVQYDNMASVQEKRASGELPAVNAGLTWGTWLDYPNFIQYKGKIYLQCAEAPNSPMDVEYFINGRRATKEAAQVICPKSEFTDHGKLDKFTVNIEHILNIR